MAPGNRRTESESGRDNTSNGSEYNRDSIGNENVHNRENRDSRDGIGNRSARSIPSTRPTVNSKLRRENGTGDNIRSNRSPTPLLNDEDTDNPDSLDNIPSSPTPILNDGSTVYVQSSPTPRNNGGSPVYIQSSPTQSNDGSLVYTQSYPAPVIQFFYGSPVYIPSSPTPSNDDGSLVYTQSYSAPVIQFFDGSPVYIPSSPAPSTYTGESQFFNFDGMNSEDRRRIYQILWDTGECQFFNFDGMNSEDRQRINQILRDTNQPLQCGQPKVLPSPDHSDCDFCGNQEEQDDTHTPDSLGDLPSSPTPIVNDESPVYSPSSSTQNNSDGSPEYVQSSPTSSIYSGESQFFDSDDDMSSEETWCSPASSSGESEFFNFDDMSSGQSEMLPSPDHCDCDSCWSAEEHQLEHARQLVEASQTYHDVRVELHPVSPQNLLGISLMGLSEEESTSEESQPSQCDYDSDGSYNFN